ncbi:Lipase (class 2) [Streptomyces noursei ATCC 11455]|nr:Lipase (class 2) [Streptomyces noursei ATCC 11455]
MARPVIIASGAGPTQNVADVFYESLKKRLEGDGYKVYIWGIPGMGLKDIAGAATSFSDKVEDVRKETGAEKVDIVSHSQGQAVARQYIRFGGGSGKVNHLVGLAPVNYGSDWAKIANKWLFGCIGIQGCSQVGTGSDFLNELNEGDDTWGDVKYANFIGNADEAVIPHRNAFLEDKKGKKNNTNVEIAGQCGSLPIVDHVGIAWSKTAYSGIQQALADKPIKLACTKIGDNFADPGNVLKSAKTVMQKALDTGVGVFNGLLNLPRNLWDGTVGAVIPGWKI